MDLMGLNLKNFNYTPCTCAYLQKRLTPYDIYPRMEVINELPVIIYNLSQVTEKQKHCYIYFVYSIFPVSKQLVSMAKILVRILDFFKFIYLFACKHFCDTVISLGPRLLFFYDNICDILYSSIVNTTFFKWNIINQLSATQNFWMNYTHYSVNIAKNLRISCWSIFFT